MTEAVVSPAPVPERGRPLPAGPVGGWLLGSLRHFRQDMLGFYKHCVDQYGDVVPYRLGSHRLVLVNHPDAVEQVLVTDARLYAKRTYVLNLLIPTLGNGLLTSEGDFWLRQRRLIQPAFHRQRLAAFAEVMVQYSQRLTAAWKEGERRDLHRDMMQLALEIVGKTLFDADVAGDAPEVGHALEVVMDRFLAKWESFLPMPDFIPTPGNLRFKQNLKRMDAIIYRMIDQRRKNGGHGNDLLSLLLAARDEDDGAGMTDRQLRDEAMTLFLAGHETTANALAWTWYLLATHPNVDRELAEELAVLGGAPPTLADLPRLPLTGWIIQESLRLYPPAYGFGRVAREDCLVTGYRVPKGTTVIVCPWTTQRDPRWFDDPLAFRPRRWGDEQALKKVPRYAYFPFGGGPRICIGNQFALMEATLVLATIAQRFRFELCPEPEVTPKAVVTLRPAHGVPVVVHRRDSQGGF